MKRILLIIDGHNFLFKAYGVPFDTGELLVAVRRVLLNHGCRSGYGACCS